MCTFTFADSCSLYVLLIDFQFVVERNGGVWSGTTMCVNCTRISHYVANEWRSRRLYEVEAGGELMEKCDEKSEWKKS